MTDSKGYLSTNDYLEALRLTQIICIDLLVENEDGKYLVGFRRNSPARNTYFVPGGRHFKGEDIDQAVSRICASELGFIPESKHFKGISTHYYPNENFLDRKGIDSHLLVLCFKTKINTGQLDPNVFHTQHTDSRWLTPSEIISDPSVHDYTKRYFNCGWRYIR